MHDLFSGTFNIYVRVISLYTVVVALCQYKTKSTIMCIYMHKLGEQWSNGIYWSDSEQDYEMLNKIIFIYCTNSLECYFQYEWMFWLSLVNNG